MANWRCIKVWTTRFHGYFETLYFNRHFRLSGIAKLVITLHIQAEEFLFDEVFLCVNWINKLLTDTNLLTNFQWSLQNPKVFMLSQLPKLSIVHLLLASPSLNHQLPNYDRVGKKCFFQISHQKISLKKSYIGLSWKFDMLRLLLLYYR